MNNKSNEMTNVRDRYDDREILDSNFENFDFGTYPLVISLDDRTTYNAFNEIVEIAETSQEEPIIFSNLHGLSVLQINFDYYKNNTDEINLKLSKVIANYKGKKLELASQLVNKQLLEAISKNDHSGYKLQNQSTSSCPEIAELQAELSTMFQTLNVKDGINEVILGSDDDPYILKQSDLEYLKNVDEITVYEVENDLKSNMPECLNYRPHDNLIAQYNFKDLNDRKKLFFNEPLTDRDISNFNYIGSQAEFISFNYYDYNNIYNSICELNNGNYKFRIKIKDKETFPYQQFSQLENVFIKSDINFYRIDYCYEQEQILQKLIKEIKDSSLSSFEKFLAVYNKVKQFKQYKENTDDSSESRDLYEILGSEYMVCAGFASLLEDLLQKVGISSQKFLTEVIANTEDNNHSVGHARVLVYLDDPKYQLKGYFISDPTWDNSLNDDFYNYALITPHEKEYDHALAYSLNDIYAVESLEELKLRLAHDKDGKMLKNFLENTQYFDKEFYEQLLVKRNQKDSDSNEVATKKKEEYTFDETIYNYIINNTQKRINGHNIIDAAMEVYKFNNPGLSIQDYLKEREKMLNDNFLRQEKAAPKMERHNKNEYEVIGNEHNKFSR